MSVCGRLLRGLSTRPSRGQPVTCNLHQSFCSTNPPSHHLYLSPVRGSITRGSGGMQNKQMPGPLSTWTQRRDCEAPVENHLPVSCALQCKHVPCPAVPSATEQWPAPGVGGYVGGGKPPKFTPHEGRPDGCTDKSNPQWPLLLRPLYTTRILPTHSHTIQGQTDEQWGWGHQNQRNKPRLGKKARRLLST